MSNSIGFEYNSGVPRRSKDPGRISFLNDIELAIGEIENKDPHAHERAPMDRTRKHLKSRHRQVAEPKIVEDMDTKDGFLADKSRLSFHAGQDQDSQHEELDYESDFEDNLTFHSAGEDSLSVLMGEVLLNPHKLITVFIVSDTGSMVQLINKQYASEQGFKAVALPPNQCFSISSPGGGADDITHVVTMEVRLVMRKYLRVVEDYEQQIFETELSEPEEKVVRMSFGVCENLPVPILWGGRQMRKYDLIDHHEQRVVSMRFGPLDRWQMPSISWMVACAEMRTLIREKQHKALKPFVPSKGRLVHMIKGERLAINLPASLLPHQNNVVRVSRHNAKVDEGFNYIRVTNEKEFYTEYGNMVEVCPSSCNGESYIVIHNYTDHVLSLPAGKLQLAIVPALALPSILTPSSTEFKNIRDTMSTEEFISDVAKTSQLPISVVQHLANKFCRDSTDFKNVCWDEVNDVSLRHSAQMPTSFVSWNMNSLRARMSQPGLMDDFQARILSLSPDIIALQEVKLSDKFDHIQPMETKEIDAQAWSAFYNPLQKDYVAYLSLSDKRYAGQAVLVKRSLSEPVVTFNFAGQEGHAPDGRYIKLEFPELLVMSVYCPFNGRGEPTKLDRRREWDLQFRQELVDMTHDKPRIVLGDFNVVLSDLDLSDSPWFWFQQGPQDLADLSNVGFGGSTEAEWSRFQDTLAASHLVDPYLRPLWIYN